MASLLNRLLYLTHIHAIRPTHPSVSSMVSSKVFFFSVVLVLSFHHHASSADTLPIHPGCFDVLNDNPGLREIDLQHCNQAYRHLPTYNYLGLEQFTRETDDTGVNRGSLGYETLSAGDWSLFRLEDNAGGTGVFSSLVIAQVTGGAGNPRLENISRYDLGDRCHFGLAWIGKSDNDQLLAATSLTPAGFFQTLVSSQNSLPNLPHNATRLKYALGAASEKLTACPTCCVGQATYEFSPAGEQWVLQSIEMDSLEWLEHAEAARALEAADQSNRDLQEDMYIPASAIDQSMLTAFLARHPQPADIRRLQYWLRESGYYWTGSVDGEWGPKTDHALMSAAKDLGIAAPEDSGHEHFANTIVSSGILATRNRLHPVDEASFDRNFEVFLNRARQAVRDQDIESFVRLTDENVVLGFGGSGGHGDLREWLQQGLFWDELRAALNMGAVKVGSTAYCLPYPACVPASTRQNMPSSASFVITAKSAELLAAPAADAASITELDYDVVEVVAPVSEQPSRFYRVHLRNGAEGYIRKTEGYWLDGYRLEIIKDSGQWQIHSVLGGD